MISYITKSFLNLHTKNLHYTSTNSIHIWILKPTQKFVVCELSDLTANISTEGTQSVCDSDS